MKKAALIFGCMLVLVGCSSQEKNNLPLEETKSEIAEEVEDNNTITENTEDAENESTEEIPESEFLFSQINGILQENKISDPIALENVEYTIEQLSSMMRVSIDFTGYNDKHLNVFCTKGDYQDWEVSTISNRDNNHVYWTTEDNLEFVDLYDYETDELIQEKKHTYEEALEEIRQKGKEEVDTLLEEQEEVKKEAEELVSQ